MARGVVAGMVGTGVRRLARGRPPDPVGDTAAEAGVGSGARTGAGLVGRGRFVPRDARRSTASRHDAIVASSASIRFREVGRTGAAGTATGLGTSVDVAGRWACGFTCGATGGVATGGTTGSRFHLSRR